MPLDELIGQLRCGDLSRFQSELDTYLQITHNTINDTDDDGMTLLMYAAGCGRLTVITWLLNRHAAIDKKSENGEHFTALDFALFNSQLETVRMLIGQNAVVNVQRLQDHLYDCMLKSESVLFPADIDLFSEAVSRNAMTACGTPSPSFIARFKKTLEEHNKEIERIHAMKGLKKEDDGTVLEESVSTLYTTLISQGKGTDLYARLSRATVIISKKDEIALYCMPLDPASRNFISEAQLKEHNDKMKQKAIEEGAEVGVCTPFNLPLFELVASCLYRSKPLIYMFAASAAGIHRAHALTSPEQSAAVANTKPSRG